LQESNVVKALVLAAGRGTRLRPLTNTIPKHLLPVGNKPILFHVLDYIAEAGIGDIGIVVSPESEAHIREAVGEGLPWRARVTFISQPEPQGLAHAVKTAQAFLGDSSFLMFLGDNLMQDGIKNFLDEFRASNVDASILLKEVPDPRTFGVAEIDSSGRVTRMVEKPQQPKSNLAIIGAYLFTAEIHNAITQIRPSSRGELEITYAIQRLMDMGRKIRSHILNGWWLDVGSCEALIEANRVVLDAFLKRDIRGTVDSRSEVTGRVEIGDDTSLKGSSIQGPVLIGANCRIADSAIRPFTNIRDGTVVENSSLQQSVILENCHISGGVSLFGSIIGRQSVLSGQKRGRGWLSAFVGDDCELELGVDNRG
jgi:glucose-1-phosphate thymidylyltransferase